MDTDSTATNRVNAFVRNAVADQLAAATKAGNARHKSGELAKSASYDARSKRLQIELVSGVGLNIPVANVQGLAGAPASVIRTVRVEGGGYGLHWPSLDLDLAVPDLLSGCFGSHEWMSALGRRGGAAATESKQQAARENGKKGGRPRKAPTIPSRTVVIARRPTILAVSADVQRIVAHAVADKKGPRLASEKKMTAAKPTHKSTSGHASRKLVSGTTSRKQKAR